MVWHHLCNTQVTKTSNIRIVNYKSSYFIATTFVSQDTMVSCRNHRVIVLRFGNDS
jgi:hypothetical protein